ncbi:hypothetical protein [Sinorhizobium meliloti]|nr:hypothetical protein U8C30_03280 [Sinorhizobium meliloti]
MRGLKFVFDDGLDRCFGCPFFRNGFLAEHRCRSVPEIEKFEFVECESGRHAFRFAWQPARVVESVSRL